ncbi:MAG: response regulator, partial [Deltaproteobacteria bacterium]|nr:response regulator [Deltaproteobacteria bacterium]
MIDPNARPPAEPAVGEVPRERVYRVMIVDVDPLMRETLTSVISKVEGFTVTHSLGNHEEVIGQFKKDMPDVAIVELDLPWMSGLDIAKKMLEIHGDTAIYIISTYDYFETSQLTLGMKLAGHILKPVSPVELTEMFKRHKDHYKLKPSPQLALLSDIVKERAF